MQLLGLRRMKCGAGAGLSVLLAVFLTATAEAATQSDEHRLSSPNARIEVVVRGGARFSYDVSWSGKPLLAGATLALDVDHTRLGIAPKIVTTKRRSTDGRIEPPVRLKSASIPERYNELRITCMGGYAVVFRAYDEGVGYRFETTLRGSSVKVYGEEAAWPLAPDTP